MVASRLAARAASVWVLIRSVMGRARAINSRRTAIRSWMRPTALASWASRSSSAMSLLAAATPFGSMTELSGELTSEFAGGGA